MNAPERVAAISIAREVDRQRLKRFSCLTAEAMPSLAEQEMSDLIELMGMKLRSKRPTNTTRRRARKGKMAPFTRQASHETVRPSNDSLDKRQPDPTHEGGERCWILLLEHERDMSVWSHQIRGIHFQPATLCVFRQRKRFDGQP